MQNGQAELDRRLAALIVDLACGLRLIFFVHWVRPENVIDQAVVVRFFASDDRIQLLKAREFVRYAAVQCKILTVDTCSDWQIVKHLHDRVIRLLVVFDEHLIPKVVVHRALSRLMVPSEQEYLVWVTDFQAEK